MLRTRIITATILIALVLGGLTLPNKVFFIVSAIIMGIGAWEWTQFIGLVRPVMKTYYVAMILWLISGVSMINAYYTLILGIVGWLFASYWIYQYAKDKHSLVEKVWVKAVSGIFVLIPCWEGLAILKTRPNGGLLILLMLLFIWSADTSAYFVGRRYGKHRLILKVSPGKTIEGLIGALVASIILALFFAWFCQLPAHYWGWWLLLALLTTVFSVLGDLFESMMKRMQGLKDSGKILPGHGGLLDRIDSLTAAVPVFVLGILLLGVG